MREKVLLGVAVPLIAAAVTAAAVGIWRWITADAPTVEVSVVSDQDAILDGDRPVGATYLIPRARAELTSPPARSDRSCAGRYEWAKSQEGIVTDTIDLRVTLTPKASASLTLSQVEVVPVRSDEPRAGIVATCAGGGASGPQDPPTLFVDLARDEPPSTRFEEPDGTRIGFNLQLDDMNAFTFDVSATAFRCDCSFYLRLTGTQDGQPQTVTIKDEHGDPFRVTSTERGDFASFDAASGEWRLAGDPPPAPPGAGLTPPTAQTSACEDIDIAQFQRSTGLRLRSRSPARSPFTFSELPGGIPVAVSICSWEAGRAGVAGDIPTFGVQHNVATDESAAQEIYEFLREGMGNNNDGRPWAAESVDGTQVEVQDGPNPILLSLRGTQIFVVTGTNGVDLNALREAARQVLAKPENR